MLTSGTALVLARVYGIVLSCFTEPPSRTDECRIIYYALHFALILGSCDHCFPVYTVASERSGLSKQKSGECKAGARLSSKQKSSRAAGVGQRCSRDEGCVRRQIQRIQKCYSRD